MITSPPTEKESTKEILQKIAEQNGALTPEAVLDFAKPKTSPIHHLFEWSNSKAAELYRLTQARELIRRIKVEYITEESKSVTVRAYHHVTTQQDSDESRGVYVPLDVAMSNYRDQLLAQCMRDMEAFRRKYAALQEIADVIAAMDSISNQRTA